MRIMTDSPISFPGLFGDWQFTASSVALHIGSRSIYWYGILITLGLVLALALCMRQKEKYGISEDNLLDGVLWGIPCGILGARIYYVLFYLDNFKNSDGSFSWSQGHRHLGRRSRHLRDGHHRRHHRAVSEPAQGREGI